MMCQNMNMFFIVLVVANFTYISQKIMCLFVCDRICMSASRCMPMVIGIIRPVFIVECMYMHCIYRIHNSIRHYRQRKIEFYTADFLSIPVIEFVSVFLRNRRGFYGRLSLLDSLRIYRAPSLRIKRNGHIFIIVIAILCTATWVTSDHHTHKKN